MYNISKNFSGGISGRYIKFLKIEKLFIALQNLYFLIHLVGDIMKSRFSGNSDKILAWTYNFPLTFSEGQASTYNFSIYATVQKIKITSGATVSLLHPNT